MATLAINLELATRGENVQDLLQLMAQVSDVHSGAHRERQRGLGSVGLNLIAKLNSRSGDSKAVLVKQFLDADHGFHIAFSIHSLPGAALHRFELRELCLPESKYVSGQAA